MELLHENQDLHAFGDCLAMENDSQNRDFGCGGGGLEDDGEEERVNREIWLDDDVGAGAGDPSLFYSADDFPPLPEFPCMSSSSSTSSTPAPSTAIPAAGFSSSTTSACSSSSSSSSSSAASWAVLRSDAEPEDLDVDFSEYRTHQQHQRNHQQQDDDGHHHGYNGMGEDFDCMNVMDDFDCMGINQLIDDSNEIWDPSPLFETEDQTPISENPTANLFEQFHQQGEFPVSQVELHQQQGEDEEDPLSDQQFLFLEGDQNGPEGAKSFGLCGNGVDNMELEKPVSSEDLAMVFFEWLKSNKESISAEDLRSIKIKKSTIESAAKRLGGGKEGMKQLLKLILQWVQNHHLHSKRSRGATTVASHNNSGFNVSQTEQVVAAPPPLPPQPLVLPNPELASPNPNPNLISHPNTPCGNPIPHDLSPCFNPPTQQQPPWIPPLPPQPPYMADPGVAIAPAPPPAGHSFPSMVSYIGGHDPYMSQPYHPPLPPEYHMLDNTMTSWARQPAPPPPGSFGFAPPPPAPMHYNTGLDGSLLQAMASQGFGSYGNQYTPYQFIPGPGDGLVRMGSSATKEARKKRMARQRRVFTHHHRNHNHTNNASHQHSNCSQQIIQGGGALDPHGGVVLGDDGGLVAHGGWVYWPPAAAAAASGGRAMAAPMMGPMQPQQQAAVVERPVLALGNSSQRQAAADKKQGLKTEKNLKFLLQKVLKQSDVGNLGRIVLPKKEAETHLPELEARDGIPIAMEDIGTSRVWNMRYRFWPNNKSRMYLLENTGDFVRSNGLQEGDFIVIYTDVKCGKYMIRGVKVRPQQGSKTEAKKPTKAQKTQTTSSPAGNGPSPLTQRQ